MVHIRQRESLPDVLTLRAEGGNFDTSRAFLAYSPDIPTVDSYLAYDASYSDGPFRNPLRYRRDNVNANFTKTLGEDEKLGSASSLAATIFILPARFRSIWLPPASSTASGTSIRLTAGASYWALVGLLQQDFPRRRLSLYP